MEKITKKMRFEMLQDLIAAAEEVEVLTEDGVAFDFRGLNEFCANQIAQLEKKAVKAKERAAKAKEKPDELRDFVLDVLDYEPKSREEIVEAVLADHPGLETATSGRVTTRLTQLIKDDLAGKEQVTVGETGNKHKVMKYFLAGAEVEE